MLSQVYTVTPAPGVSELLPALVLTCLALYAAYAALRRGGHGNPLLFPAARGKGLPPGRMYYIYID